MRVAAAAVVAAVAHAAAAAAAAIAQYIYFVTYYDITRSSVNFFNHTVLTRNLIWVVIMLKISGHVHDFVERGMYVCISIVCVVGYSIVWLVCGVNISASGHSIKHDKSNVN